MSLRSLLFGQWVAIVVLLGCPAPEPTEPMDTSDPETATDTATTTEVFEPKKGPAEFFMPWASLNPEYTSVIQVAWAQTWEGTVAVEYSFEEGSWLRSPDRDLPLGEHQELLLGVPYDTEVTWRLVSSNTFGDAQSKDAVISTGARPSRMPVATVLVHDTEGVDAEMDYVLVAVTEGRGITTRGWTMVMDHAGRVVWAHRSPNGRNTMHPRLNLAEDTFLIDHSSYFSSFDCGAASEVVELKIDGSEVQRIAVPGHHHPFTELADGTIAYASYRDCYGSPGDDVIALAHPDGTLEDLFSCADFLDDIGEFGWCGSNTLSHDAQRGVFLFSLFTHNTVVELNAAKGTPIRWFGQANGAWGFSPASSAFDYQHGAYYTEDGTILLSTHSDRSPYNVELAVREYEVNTANQTLDQIWSFGQGKGVVGSQMGEAHRLPGGNTLHNHGSHAVLREITTDGVVVWDVRWETQQYAQGEGHTVGRSAPITGSLYDFAPERL